MWSENEMDETNDEIVLRWFGRIERRESERIVKMIHIIQSRMYREPSIGSTRKSCMDSVNTPLFF